MNGFDFASLPFQNSFHVHQAAYINTGYIIHIVGSMLFYPVLTHSHTHSFFKNRKGSAKTTSLVIAQRLQQLYPFYFVQ